MARPTAIDLFCGAGGMSLGLEQAGFDVIAGVEYDPVHLATHEFNFPASKSICRDIGDLKAEDLRLLSGLGTRSPDLVVGGPPCQGFSMIGKRSVEDARNQLVFDFHRMVTGLGARYFVMENVPGLKVGEHAGLLGELICRFDSSGYETLPVQLLNALDFGTPQDRTRLFLVGFRRGEPSPQLTQPTHSRLGTALPKPPTVWDAIGDLPEVEHIPELLRTDEALAKFGSPSLYARDMRWLTRPTGDRSYRRLWDPDVLTSSLRTAHSEESVARFERTKPGSVEPVSRFLRLPPDGYCNTLRAGTDSKRGAHTSPRPIHPTTPRVITVREAARLHSFPDYFRFHSTKWHGFRQVGNAVVPNVGRAVGNTILIAMGQKVGSPRLVYESDSVELLHLTMTTAAERFDVPSNIVGSRDRKSNALG